MAQLKKFQSGTSGESVTFVTANVTTANAGQVNVDNLRLDGNTLSSTNTNGDIELTPNGNGRVTTPALSATSPRVITAINDTNGNELFGVTATGSAVNEFTVANAATGNAPTLSATGGDTNIGMALTPKGTGGVIFPAGAVGTPAITTTGDLNTGIYFPAADTIAFTEGGVEAMRIDSSGNVGIGTGSPSVPLTVRSNSGGNAVRLLGRAADGFAFLGFRNNADSANNGEIGISDAQNMLFTIGATERARITSGGDFLVGGTSPVETFAGVPTIQGANNCIFVNKRDTTGSASHFRFYNPNGVVGDISTSGSSTTYGTSSDYRLKENVAPMTGALAKVLELNPVTYTWKVDGSAGQGFIAHELAEVCPDAVTGEKDEVEIRQVEVSPAVYEDVVIPAVLDEDGNEVEPERTEKRLVSEAVMEEREVPKYQGVDTSFLVATLTAAIQELKAINDAQAQRIETLEAKVAALESKE